jgi:hypothetical protein
LWLTTKPFEVTCTAASESTGIESANNAVAMKSAGRSLPREKLKGRVAPPRCAKAADVLE